MRKLVSLGVLLTLVSAEAAPKQKKGDAPGTKINGVVYGGAGAGTASALSPELALRLKKVFLFPAIDDLSGALAPKLDEKLVDLFSHNTRFELIRDPQVVKALSPDEAAYARAAVSQEVHREAAKVTGADTTVLLRTRNIGAETRIALEIRDAGGANLFVEEGSLPGNSKMEERWLLIEKLYSGVLARLPFEGSVTGRTAATLTLDLGLGSMRQNEEVEIARIVSIQKHPLLGTVIGTDYVRTGRARVTAVDKVLSFAEIIEEFPGEKVAPGNKVLRNSASLVRRGGGNTAAGPKEKKPEFKKEEVPSWEEKKEDSGEREERLTGDFEKPKQRYGKLGANILYGSISHSQTLAGNVSDYSGSGIGGRIDGELWVTKSWILASGYGFHGADLSGTSGVVGSSRWSAFELLGGYRIFPDGVAEGLAVTGGVGFESMRFGIPANTALSLNEKAYGGIIFKVSGEMSFLGAQKIEAGFHVLPFGSFDDAGNTLGRASNATIIGVQLAWTRLLLDQLWLKVGAQYDVANGSYEGSATTASDKHFALGPGIYYLF